ncbi:hypothetical protein C8Q74DRAFT_574582 [Fomes fomentarius]|nr:hypothetical protein C8Q74DRAFT_574582 [Fomes fomentarius]
MQVLLHMSLPFITYFFYSPIETWSLVISAAEYALSPAVVAHVHPLPLWIRSFKLPLASAARDPSPSLAERWTNVRSRRTSAPSSRFHQARSLPVLPLP